MPAERTVLLVDDDPELRAALRVALESTGYRLLEAADGRSALGLLRESEPSLVLLDVILPDISGYEVCEQLRKWSKHAHRPVVMLSARAYPEDRVHALEAGADEFLSKPVSFEKLFASLEMLIRRPGIEAVA